MLKLQFCYMLPEKLPPCNGNSTMGGNNRNGSPATTLKPPTRVIRLHRRVVDLAKALAVLHGESLPDFVSNRLWPLLQEMRADGSHRFQELGERET